MLKKIISIIIIAVLIISSSFTYAADTQNPSDWKDSLKKLESMGVVNESNLNLTGYMTREVFSKIIVNASGNYELAQALSTSSAFPDVSDKSEYAGYINAAVEKEYLSVSADGKFEPKTFLNFAQLCTAMVKALGYTSADIYGSWPAGYLEKAKGLGLTKDFNLKSTDRVTTAAVITMIDRMLNTNIKKTNSAGEDIKLIDSTGLLEKQNNLTYSEPEVAFNFDPASKKIGKIKFDDSIPILRTKVDNTVSPAESTVGEKITLSDIRENNIVYQVYNNLEQLIYYLVIDNKVEGKITSILPNKYSPTSIKINNIGYDLGEYAKLKKFNSSKGSFNVGDDVTVVIGYDGKVVDAYLPGDESNEDYAFVVNTSTTVSKDAADYGKIYYTVELMHVDGTTKFYRTTENPANYRWRLVRFSYIDSQTVALLNLNYSSDTNIDIDKYEKKVGQNYITDRIKIFNYTESGVNLIDWNSLPNGQLAAGKVKYIGTTGDFDDVNILLTYDVFNEQYKNFVVQKIQIPNGKNVTEYVYTLAAGGNQFTYSSKSEITGAIVGSVFSMKMFNNKISSFSSIKNPEGTGWYFQAIDSKRVKMNNWVYMFGPSVTIYVKDYSGNLSVKNIADITAGDMSYASVRIYCDRPLNNGGKVEAIVISYN